ncbi:MAG: hypothetical protein B7C24_15700 [Bacteroidetes bacterium 4572_77]|nr:MAG: hypothetical protein B7C24_15700 [Bacteroidetes bacterium 4572_77]
MFSGNKEKKMSAAIKEWLNENNLDSKIEETRLMSEWENIVGSLINEHTVSKRIDKGVLYIKLDSASLRHELSYARDKLKNNLNKTVGKEVIINIVFT